MAPDAELVFVHLSQPQRPDLHSLGDSVRLLEALDFIFRYADQQPCVVSLSIGSHGGPHDGTTLAERGFDAAVAAAPGRAICQSAGNYRNSRHHARRRLSAGETWALTWETAHDPRRGDELEVWYPGSDELGVELTAPDRSSQTRVGLGGEESIQIRNRVVGRLYHRSHDPNNGDHHIDIFLYRDAPHGEWQVRLTGRRVQDGRVQVWAERKGAAVQSRLEGPGTTRRGTVGTIATGRGSLVVGAYDSHHPASGPAPFSSMGPTRDGRAKPDVVAPGVEVLAASSNWRTGNNNERKSGTSMAAPMVAGLVACMFEASPGLSMNDIRRLITTNAQAGRAGQQRIGRGRVRPERSVSAAANMRSTTIRRRPENTSTEPETERLLHIPTTTVPPDGLAAWQDLIRFVLPRPAAAVLRRTTTGARPHPIGAGWGPINLDFYGVEVQRLPPSVTAAWLLQHMRLNLNQFLDTTNTRFGPYNSASWRVWTSPRPVGAAVHIDFSPFGLNVDDGTVVCSQSETDNWIFSTIWTPRDGNHPVSGNRMFGFSQRGGSLVFFTMGADRLTTALDWSAERALGLPFRAADALWRSFQARLVGDIRRRGGAAHGLQPLSNRYSWPVVRRLHAGPSPRSATIRLP